MSTTKRGAEAVPGNGNQQGGRSSPLRTHHGRRPCARQGPRAEVPRKAAIVGRGPTGRPGRASRSRPRAASPSRADHAKRTGCSVSTFPFYGAADIMESDLSGLQAYRSARAASDDAHLSNFGMFAAPGSPARLAETNDFDESSPRPFEWGP